jgi:hypothetical protein
MEKQAGDRASLSETVMKAVRALNVLREEKDMPKGLMMRSIPYIGQYRTIPTSDIGEIYAWTHPMAVYHPTPIDVVSLLPEPLQRSLQSFCGCYPKGEIECFVINHDGTSIMRENAGNKDQSKS